MLAAGGFLDPKQLLSNGGYALLFLIIFAESGLLVGFFLPGDSLLFTAGAIAAGAFAPHLDVDFNVVVLCVGCFLAAVIGDQVGYLIGAKAGRRLFNRPDSRLFKKEYVDKAEGFFARYGAKAIVLARFVPVVRTFVPTVAGVSRMNYPLFLRFNLIGGLIWGVGVTLLGYLFGNISYVKENFEIAILGVVVLSLAPILFEVLSHRRSAGQS
ncbi:MAG: VTT domain-containing protein [Actinobacteria bacterium]|nr:VTT domain-containing protein [Actinomycetota bacterium]